jgi:hypothetical protein
MENISDKPKRGRPKLLDEWIEEKLRDDWGPFATERTVQNAWYHIRAFNVLGFGDDAPLDPFFLWLCDPERQRGPSGKVFRKTILTELGRIGDDETLIAVAREICDLKPKARDAVALIRRARLGGGKPKPNQLGNEIIRAINAYQARYPSTTPAEIAAALTAVYAVVTRGRE